jgi:hypothetical protein
MPSKLVMLSWSDDSPLMPGNALPTPPMYPSQGLPSGGHISTLPVYPFDPTMPPVAGAPPVATNPIAPGHRYVVKWLACVGLILVPDNTLPATPEPK